MEDSARDALVARLQDLPPESSVGAERCYAEAVSDEAIADVHRHRGEVAAANAASWAMAKELGAVGYLPAHGWGEKSVRVFAFNENPGKAWKLSERRSPSGTATLYQPSQTPAGLKLEHRLAALPPYPNDALAGGAVGAITDLVYDQGDMRGVSSGVGYDQMSGRMLFPSYSWVKDRMFVTWPNHFWAMWKILEQGGGPFRDLEALMAWRPPEGYDMLTPAEFQLISAQARVEAEDLRKRLAKLEQEKV